MGYDPFGLPVNPFYQSLAIGNPDNNRVGQNIRAGINNINDGLHNTVQGGKQVLTALNDAGIPAPTPLGPLGHQIDLLA